MLADEWKASKQIKAVMIVMNDSTFFMAMSPFILKLYITYHKITIYSINIRNYFKGSKLRPQFYNLSDDLNRHIIDLSFCENKWFIGWVG